ncbi:MAG: TolB family protein [Solirubrobacterales bacterium]
MRRAVPAALAAALVLLTLPVAVAAAPTPSGPRLAIVKETWRPNRVRLLTVGPRGGTPVRLAGGQEQGGPVEGFGPLSWRSDGEMLAFNGLLSFFLAAATGGEVQEINAAGAEWPVFAPDGNTIAFTREELRGESIWTIDLETWEQRQLTPSRPGLTYVASSFSPDGTTLLATRAVGRRRPAEPIALDLATGKATRLLADGLQPVYSPDGTKIALFRKVGRGKFNDLFVLDLGSRKLRRLTRTDPGYELFASWDPSGERIAFVRYRGRHFEWANSVLEINADGSCETEIFPLKRRTIYSGPAWQPGPGREAGRIRC